MGQASAHQPVELGSKNTRADQGPILAKISKDVGHSGSDSLQKGIYDKAD
jgi:hypothetical protein